MPRPDLPSPEAVRALVERVVDSVLGADVIDIEASAIGTPSEVLPPDMSVAIGADHGGFPVKERVAFRLRERGYTVRDLGTDSSEAVDYPLFAKAVADSVAAGESRWGIIVDGAGIGSAMVANKVPGVRAALCYDISSARNSREHNHANVLTLGAGLIGEALAWQIVETWLATEWGGGRHARRVAMIDEIERPHAGVPA